MIATTYYLHLPHLHQTYDLWQRSCDAVRDYEGIVWSMSFQPIVPVIIARSPFLQEAIPTLSTDRKPIVVAQLIGNLEGFEGHRRNRSRCPDAYQ